MIKNIYNRTKDFLIKHYKLSVSITILLIVISSAACVYSRNINLPASSFLFSFFALMCLITYKTGKIPLIMIDRTWDAYRLKYGEEEAEIKYKEMRIRNAVIFFILAIAISLVMLFFEALELFRDM